MMRLEQYVQQIVVHMNKSQTLVAGTADQLDVMTTGLQEIHSAVMENQTTMLAMETALQGLRGTCTQLIDQLRLLLAPSMENLENLDTTVTVTRRSVETMHETGLRLTMVLSTIEDQLTLLRVTT